MVTFSFFQMIELAGIMVGVSATLFSAIVWILERYKQKITLEIQNEFRHEIDRIVTEQNQALCFLEENFPGYQRLEISGKYRSIFYQSCEKPDDLQNRY